jgi:hypothetical protein
VNSQRNTLAVDHHHALRAFPPLSFPDLVAPFFAGAKSASINAFSQRRRPRSSSSPRNVRQTRSHTSCSSHSRSRRQQVDGLGYSTGRSRHRAPLFSTHKIPSMQSRWPMNGRPPCRCFGRGGSSGSIFFHCLSVNRIPRRAIRVTSK